ncbi:MAG: hypothetical protein WCL23_00075 [Candidatus Moraniibacteriota bacterium]
MNTFIIRPLGPFAAARDLLFSSVAERLSIPLTHLWNRVRLTTSKRKRLRDNISATVTLSGDPDALKGNHPFRSHIWFLGGWRRYAVLKACIPWYVGWIVPDGNGGEICEVSRIPIDGKVRMLLGPEDVSFFAIEADSGHQLIIDMVGGGRLGKDDKHRNAMLL